MRCVCFEEGIIMEEIKVFSGDNSHTVFEKAYNIARNGKPVPFVFNDIRIVLFNDKK